MAGGAAERLAQTFGRQPRSHRVDGARARPPRIGRSPRGEQRVDERAEPLGDADRRIEAQGLDGRDT